MAPHESRISGLTAIISLITAALSIAGTLLAISVKPNAFPPIVVNAIVANADSKITDELRAERDDARSTLATKIADNQRLEQRIAELTKQACVQGVITDPTGIQPPPPKEITWDDNAHEWARRYESVQVLTCPPNGSVGDVVGDGIYSFRSSVCSAAVHAGVIRAQIGGPITIKMEGPSGPFKAVLRNRVYSRRLDGVEDGFSFVKK
jgi:hypothetical protein